MNNYYSILVETVARLAANASEQEAYVKQLGVGVDELALEYDDFFILAAQKVEAGELSRQTYDALSALDKKLDDMSGRANAHLWTVAALRNRDEWKEVRKLASKALVFLEGQID